MDRFRHWLAVREFVAATGLGALARLWAASAARRAEKLSRRLSAVRRGAR